MAARSLAPTDLIGREVSQPAKDFGAAWALETYGEEFHEVVVGGKVQAHGGPGTSRAKPFLIQWTLPDETEVEAVKLDSLLAILVPIEDEETLEGALLFLGGMIECAEIVGDRSGHESSLEEGKEEEEESEADATSMEHNHSDESAYSDPGASERPLPCVLGGLVLRCSGVGRRP
jgi:hypothetical protein